MMINSNDELIAWVDEEDVVLWLKQRKEFYEWEFIHRSVWLMVVNQKKEVLICLRNRKKKQEPGVYSHSVDWWVGDEAYDEAIRKELQEELHLEGPIQFLYKYFYEKKWVDKMWKAVYICYSDEIPDPDPDEIEHIRRMSLWILEFDMQENSSHYSESFKKSMDIFIRMVKEWAISL